MLILLTILLAAAALAAALGAAGAAAPPGVHRLGPALAGVGLAAAVAAGLGVALGGAAEMGGAVRVGVDGLSVAVLAAAFLLGGAGAGLGAAGAVAVAALAGDGVVLVLALGALVLLARRRVGIGLAGVALAAVAVVVLGGTDPRFAALRLPAAEPLRAGIAVAAALLGAGLLAEGAARPWGALAAVYVVARLGFDLAGPGVAGWWGLPLVLLGAGAAVLAAWRAGRAPTLDAAAVEAVAAGLAGALVALGAALLARGADLPPLVAWAAAAALLQVWAVALWGAAVLAGARACAAAVGGAELTRMGGLLRRLPVPGGVLLLGLAGMAGVPGTVGFAGTWAVLQAMLGAGRAGGLLMPAFASLGAAALGLAWGLLGVGAVRLAGAALLGVPRTGKAATAIGPRRVWRAALLALGAVCAVLGAWPGPLVALVQPGAALLAGRAAAGAGWAVLAPTADVPGYVAPAVLAVLLAATALAAWAAAAGPDHAAPAPAARWEGGFPEPGIGRGNDPALPLPRPALPASGRVALAAAALALAFALGWAAR